MANLLGGDIQLPPVLDAACYDTSDRGPAANSGLLAHKGIGDAVVLEEIVRQGEAGEQPRGVLTRLRTYSLTADDADWLILLQVDKLPNAHRGRVGEKAMYLFSTHNEERARGKKNSDRVTIRAAGQSRI